MKRVLITQSNYIPWKGYFDSIANSDVFVVFDDMQYTRRDWRNRNYIKTAAGLKWLTIPVEVKGKYYQKINETKISDPHWREKHWSVIRESYKNAPCFLNMSGWIEEIYKTADQVFLTEVNLHFLKEISIFLGIKTQFKDSREFKLAEGKTNRLVHLCKDLQADRYLTGPAAQAYLNEDEFRTHKIAVDYANYDHYRAYDQLHGEFVHHVSILDLIFNVGTEAKKYLKYVT